MRAFVIERMYAGSYISDKLGGEFINLLHDDHGNNYIFVSPHGFIDKKYDDKVETVILTRLVKDGCFEILGIAIIPKDGQVTYQKGYTLEDKFQNGKSVISKFVDEYDVRYGGVSFKDINYETFAGADITFKSSKLLFPKHELYITDCKNSEFEEEGVIVKNLKDKRFPKQSLHSYITDIDNPKSFSVIEKIIKDANLWVERINKIDNFKIHDRHFNYKKRTMIN